MGQETNHPCNTNVNETFPSRHTLKTIACHNNDIKHVATTGLITNETGLKKIYYYFINDAMKTTSRISFFNDHPSPIADAERELLRETGKLRSMHAHCACVSIGT